MNVKFDENNVPVEVNGKKVMKSYQNAYRKASNTDYFVDYRHCNIAEAQGVVLNPFEVSIYQWVLRWEMKYNYAINHGIFPITKITKAPVTTFDNMRYFLASLNEGNYNLIN